MHKSSPKRPKQLADSGLSFFWFAFTHFAYLCSPFHIPLSCRHNSCLILLSHVVTHHIPFGPRNASHLEFDSLEDPQSSLSCSSNPLLTPPQETCDLCTRATPVRPSVRHFLKKVMSVAFVIAFVLGLRIHWRCQQQQHVQRCMHWPRLLTSHRYGKGTGCQCDTPEREPPTSRPSRVP